MKAILIIFGVIFCLPSQAQQQWTQIENREGGFTASMPEIVDFYSSDNTTMYSSIIDSAIVLKLLFVKNMPANNKAEDVLLRYTQFMLYTLPEAKLESRKITTSKGTLSQEVCVSYANYENKGRDLILNAVYFYADKHITLSTGGTEENFEQIFGVKTTFFNSFQFTLK